MARALVSAPSLVTTLAQFKTWGTTLQGMFRTVLTQTNDTGQVNWATLAALPASGAQTTYEVYAFGDAAQGTSPLYVRIDYVYYSVGTGAYPIFRVGTGTDGAGNIINQAPQVQLQGYGYNSQQTYLASNGDGSQLVFAHGMNVFAGGIDNLSAIVIERFRNADGSPNTEGVNIWGWLNSAAQVTNLSALYTRTFASPTGWITEPNPPIWIPWISGPVSAFSGTVATAFPFFTWGERQVRGPSQAVLFGYQGDWPRLSEVTVTHSGGPKKFWSLGNAMLSRFPSMQADGINSTTRFLFTPLFRFE